MQQANINYNTLKQLEEDEWKELDDLRKEESLALKNGDIDRYNIVHLSAQYTLGRWGVISELLDLIKGDN